MPPLFAVGPLRPVPRRVAELAPRGRPLHLPTLLLARHGPAPLDHQRGDLPHVGTIHLHRNRHRGQLGLQLTRLSHLPLHHGLCR